jgi:hypothetical protein
MQNLTRVVENSIEVLEDLRSSQNCDSKTMTEEASSN